MLRDFGSKIPGRSWSEAIALGFNRQPGLERYYKVYCMWPFIPLETIPVTTQSILSSMVCLYSSTVGRGTGVLVYLITGALETMTDQFRPRFQP